jgi:PhzF family phenazine biosynthesis protein
VKETAMTQRPFKQVDVFTDTPYRGNPLAVVLDGSGISTEVMQHFTNWTNLSEATFLLPPTPEGAAAGADYRVRIFCPGRELPFAGHPTLGSCHAWLEAGGKSKDDKYIVQECSAGLIRLKRHAGNGQQQLAFAAPPLQRSGPLDEADVALIARGLGLQRSDILHHAWCDNGPGWRAVMLSSAAQVLSLAPDAAVLAGLDVGVVGPHPAGHDCAYEVRAFFPGNNGLVEDPVTGSLNAALAQWLMGAGLAPDHYCAAQGTALARAGRVQVSRQGADIWIGGSSVTCVDGLVRL